MKMHEIYLHKKGLNFDGKKVASSKMYFLLYIQAGPKSTHIMTQCLCNHLTWFGSSLFVPPNSLDISAQLAKLKHFDESPALLATVCVTAGLFIFFLVLARRKDKRDNIKVMGRSNFPDPILPCTPCDSTFSLVASIFLSLYLYLARTILSR